MTKNKKIVVAIIVLVIIILVLFSLYSFTKPQSAPPLSDEQRMELLQQPSNIPPANPKMTDAERLKILSQPAKNI
jgi:flagellar biosynthesis/type III secretory pathway M-ring protein FliF/YscJ